MRLSASSKMYVEQNGRFIEGFIGATDSAWACSFLLHLASQITPQAQRSQLGVQIIFFDGEEPFSNLWHEHDSIYGAKHLVKTWSNPKPASHNTLKDIEYFVLLDLLGAANPKLYSFFPDTRHIFHKLCSIETQMRKESKLLTHEKIFIIEREFPGRQNGIFTVQDDHTPFAMAGVPIIHLIPIPFPWVWHRMNDDRTALHYQTCHDLALILIEFVIQEIS